MRSIEEVRQVQSLIAGGLNNCAISRARYTFSNRSEDIKAIFCEHLDLLGIAWRRMNAMNISVARRGAVARLDEFVGPKQ